MNNERRLPRLPLEGVRVLDITVVWAGPFATNLLADMGAEVIRVESIHHFPHFTRGNVMRPHATQMAGGYGARFPDRNAGAHPWNREANFNGHARNKLSCCMDLTRPQGVDIFKRLVKVSDVFLENNRHGTTDNLGIGYEALKTVRPDLIMISLPAFGNTGPYKSWVAFGPNLEAVSGHSMLRHYPDLDPSQGSSVLHSDAAGGVCAALAVLAALYHRRRTGQGQFIDMAQLETLLPQLPQAILDNMLNGRVRPSLGNRHPSRAPQGCYRCQGKDKWVVISVGSDAEWEGFCRALGNPPWTQEERFADPLSRMKHHDALDQHIGEWTALHTHYEVMHLLQKEGVPAGPVMAEDDVWTDPHVKARDFWREISHPEAGTHLYPGFLWQYSRTPLAIRRHAPLLGQDNDYIYRELLGLSEAEATSLEKDLIIGGDTYLEATTEEDP